jgi:EAL domain-containing protein (putative c-di-GMP-specific phosphodiesterase class I)
MVNIGEEEFESHLGCAGCKGGLEQPFPFSMAFQPIIDVEARRIYAFEALVRGTQGQSAATMLAQVSDQNRYAFDQSCRVQAITLAAQLGLAHTGARLSINFMPGAVYSPAACIQATLRTAREVGFPLAKLIFEVTEAERVLDPAHLRSIVEDYNERGFLVAIDDFGAGYAGLSLLADIPVDILKLDMGLTRNLDQRPKALAIVRSVIALGRQLGCQIIAEGVETLAEYEILRSFGITLMQGFLFAKPAFEQLPTFTLPA